MKHLLFVVLIGLAVPCCATSSESIVVVANTQDPSIRLTRQEIRNLFMGNVLSYDLKAVTLPPENQIRVLFNTKVVGLTESRIQSYWAQMRFSGRKKQPKELTSETLVIKYLQANPGTVSYVSADADIPDGLTVLFQTN
jgi:hypothetical protein